MTRAAPHELRHWQQPLAVLAMVAADATGVSRLEMVLVEGSKLMERLATPYPVALGTALYLSLTTTAVWGETGVDLLFEPVTRTAVFHELVSIDIIARSSDGTAQAVIGIDAILEWDPVSLKLVEFDAHEVWSPESGFLPDPDGINAGVNDPLLGFPKNDGDAIFTALAEPGSPVIVASDDVTVATLGFRVLMHGEGVFDFDCSPVLQLVPLRGTFGQTRVLGEGLENDITGDISGTAIVQIEPCPIPTLSEWGLLTMALLVLATGTLAIRRGRYAPSRMAANKQRMHGARDTMAIIRDQ